MSTTVFRRAGAPNKAREAALRCGAPLRLRAMRGRSLRVHGALRIAERQKARFPDGCCREAVITYRTAVINGVHGSSFLRAPFGRPLMASRPCAPSAPPCAMPPLDHRSSPRSLKYATAVAENVIILPPSARAKSPHCNQFPKYQVRPDDNAPLQNGQPS